MIDGKRVYSCAVLAAVFMAPLMKAYDSAYHDAIANIALQAFTTIDSEKKLSQQKSSKKWWSSIIQLFKPYQSTFVALPGRSQLEDAFIYFQQESNESDAMNSIEIHTIKELELVRGNTAESDTLIAHLTSLKGTSFLSTMIGYKVFIETLTHPQMDTVQIKQRQRIIELLREHGSVREKCFALLQKMKKAEAYFLDCYHKRETEDEKRTILDSSFLRVLRLADKPTAISVLTRLSLFFPVVTVTLTAAEGALLMRGALSMGRLSDENLTKGTMAGALYSSLVNIPLFFRHIDAVGLLCKELKKFQEQMIQVATFMRSAEQLLTLLSEQSSILRAFPGLKEKLAFLQEGRGASSKCRKLNTLLRESTFNEGAPSFFSSPGNIMLAYRYFSDKSVQDEYISLMNTIGNIDAFVALAKKMDAHTHLGVPFCFASFKTESDRPKIDAVQFWNPFIDPEKAVPNSLSLNADDERNCIITGPNMGGKSTTAKALMISILLAQTYGIAPAQSLTITPFSKLLTYLQVSDYTAGGLSLFKAEVNRASALMQVLKVLKDDEWAFVLIDEIFTSTSPDKAEELSYRFMKKMSELKNVIWVSATHHKHLTDLEKETEGMVKNYRMEVVTDTTGKVDRYTYTLAPGIGAISNAQQLAQEVGIEF